MEDKKYNSLVKGSRPEVYGYDSKSLEKQGYYNKYLLDEKNQDFKKICEDLKNKNVNFEIRIRPDRPKMRDIWIRK